MRFFLMLIATIAAAFAGEGRFLGWQSCATSGCHNGGTGKDQLSVWQKDRHARAHEILFSGQSKRIAETLKIGEAAKSTQCTVCHSPMMSVPPERREGELAEKPNRGVSCENCHGPAEHWLRFHTRPDTTVAQRAALGLRDLSTALQRANACVACHGTLPPGLREAGHPELRFDLARQTAEMPPHWQAEALSPARSWLTGQAALLRELCWQVEKNRASMDTHARIAALHWLLRETDLGKKTLPEKLGPALREAAQTLAQAANRSRWSLADSRAQFDRLLALAPGLRSVEPEVQFRRAQALGRAIAGLVYGVAPQQVPKVRGDLDFLHKLIYEPVNFDLARFEDTLKKIAATLATP